MLVKGHSNPRLLDPSFNARLLNPKHFNHEFSTPDPYGVEKSEVKKFGVEMSCNLLESGHFNPAFLNQRLFNHELFNHELFNHIGVWG